MYVFREYCLQLIMYFGSAQSVVERVINVRYYYYYYLSIILFTHENLAQVNPKTTHKLVRFHFRRKRVPD